MAGESSTVTIMAFGREDLLHRQIPVCCICHKRFGPGEKIVRYRFSRTSGYNWEEHHVPLERFYHTSCFNQTRGRR